MVGGSNDVYARHVALVPTVDLLVSVAGLILLRTRRKTIQ